MNLTKDEERNELRLCPNVLVNSGTTAHAPCTTEPEASQPALKQSTHTYIVHTHTHTQSEGAVTTVQYHEAGLRVTR